MAILNDENQYKIMIFKLVLDNETNVILDGVENSDSIGHLVCND